MKPFHVLPISLILSGAASAGDYSGKESAIEMPAAKSRWTFGASFAPLLNVEADFSGLGSFGAPFAPQALGPGQNHEYEDGYVRVDSSGNAGGLTGYWGYDNASQYDAGTNTLSFNLTSGASNGRAGETEEYSPGFEVFGYLEMGDIATLANRRISWGFKGGFHYAKVDAGGRSSLTADAIRITDNYDTTGIFLFPSPGYQGTYGGMGPLISDNPLRTTTVLADGAVVNADIDLDVHLFTLTAGPYIEIPVADRFSLFAEAGLSLSVARGDYDFETSTSIAGLGTQTSRGDDTRTVLLPGAYAGVSAIWQLTDRFGLHGSARYQYIDRFEMAAGESETSLSFDGAAVLSLGGVWTF